MTKLTTVCECGHSWEIHNKPENRCHGIDAGCLHVENNNYCSCEKFYKKEDTAKKDQIDDEAVLIEVVS